MDGADHYAWAPVVAVPVAALSAGGDPLVIAVTIGTAIVTSGGWLSPDADHTWLSWVPGGHRGLTHWPALPAALWLLAEQGWLPFDDRPVILGLYLGTAAGWLSHDLGDLLFGKASPSRPPGIPLLGWTGYLGLDDLLGFTLRSGGTVAHLVATRGSVVLVAWELICWRQGGVWLPRYGVVIG